jgi:GDP-L-fucose synthase
MLDVRPYRMAIMRLLTVIAAGRISILKILVLRLANDWQKYLLKLCHFGVRMSFSLIGKRIFVAGHRGMVGSAIVRRLSSENCEILTANREKLDLLDQNAVRSWMCKERPDAVVLAAAKVGGIVANNSYPADFLYNNLVIASNVIEASHRADVNRLLFLGSSCIYPKLADQPIAEDALLTGPLEPTNEWYTVAKIAGIKLGQAYRRQYERDYISAMPTNLYGPGDNFDLNSSHVLPALIRKAHEAKIAGAPTMTIWGTGTPKREFLHADDCADACVYLLGNYSEEQHINVGSGHDISIFDLARLVKDIVGFGGEIECDRLRDMGWKPTIDLHSGIAQVYQDFCKAIT